MKMAVRTSSNYKEGLKCLGAFLGDVGCQDLLKPPAANAPQALPADLDGAQLAGTVRATMLRSGPLGGRTVAKRETGKLGNWEKVNQISSAPKNCKSDSRRTACS